MFLRVLVVLAGLSFGLGSTLRAQGDLDVALSDLLRAGPAASAQEKAVAAVMALKPERSEVLRRLRAGVLPAVEEGVAAGWSVLEARDEAGERFPYQLYLPERLLEPEVPLPLLLHLHGSVARAAYAIEPGDTGYGRRLWVEPADDRGFVLVCPLGKKGREWWTPLGVRAVEAVLRDVQRRLPVDDDRVVATGFSDGASGCFHLAMTRPGRFAAFIPMNGHPAVPATASGRELFPSNLAATPMTVFMTRDDALYPSSAVLPHFQPALAAGAALRLVSWESGNHRPAYFDSLKGMIVDLITTSRRNREPGRLRWRFDGPGEYAGLRVEGLGGVTAPASQVMSGPGRISLGVEAAPEEAGAGILIARVTPGGTAAALGLKAGDRLLAIGDVAMESSFSVFQAFASVSRGDAITARLQRAGQEEVLEGRVPPHVARPVYRRGAPVGAIDLRRLGSGALSLETRGVARATWFWRGPGAPPKNVTINGESKTLAWKELPLTRILKDFAAQGDRAQVASHEVGLSF